MSHDSVVVVVLSLLHTLVALNGILRVSCLGERSRVLTSNHTSYGSRLFRVEIRQ